MDRSWCVVPLTTDAVRRSWSGGQSHRVKGLTVQMSTVAMPALAAMMMHMDDMEELHLQRSLTTHQLAHMAEVVLESGKQRDNELTLHHTVAENEQILALTKRLAKQGVHLQSCD